jgi:hypothetical protein
MSMTPDWCSMELVSDMVKCLRPYVTGLPTDGKDSDEEKAMVRECELRLRQFLWAFERYQKLRDDVSAWQLPDPSTRPGQG